jgi:DNA-binding GntR family transcriptional regulator
MSTSIQTGSSLMEIARPPLKDVVFDRIMEAILAGEFKAGQRITELGIAKRLGVAQATVREAFVALEHHGFLQRRGSRATHVTQLTPEDVRAIYVIRNRLEMLVVELITSREELELSDIERALAKMATAAARKDLQGFYRADLSFHQAMAGATANRHLCEVLDVLLVKLFAFDAIQQECPPSRDLEVLVAEHRHLLDLLRSRDADGARAFMEEAMQKARNDDLSLAGI